VIVAIIAAVFLPRAFRLQKDGIAYLQVNLKPILENWDDRALIARASPELMKAVKSPDEMARLFRYFKALGALQSLQEPVAGNVNSGTTVENGAYTLADYTIEGNFEKGPATISVQLLRTNDTWKINGFHINSDAFLPK